jgi:hypothetical protein
MAPFFSYKTFSSVGAAVGVDAAGAGGVTVPIELINFACLNFADWVG